VVPEGGTPEPRLVQIGLNDWDNTQVVSGLEAGATVAVIGAAQLQAQQAEMLQRMRSRMGGGPLGRR
jgi:HlyD family secretion protein